MLYAHWSDVPPHRWPWQNFSPQELASRGDGSILIDQDAMEKLQWARSTLGRALVVSSAYRDPIHNARVGGAPRSSHKAGHAFDLGLSGHDRHGLLTVCRSAGFSGFGFYQTFLHVDCGPARQWHGGNIARKLWTTS